MAGFLDICDRAEAVTLRGKGKLTRAQIQEATGVSPAQLTRLVAKAKERGWQPGERCRDHHVADRARQGRPKLIVGNLADRTISLLTRNSTTRGYSALELAQKLSEGSDEPQGTDEGDLQPLRPSVSRSSIQRFLRKQGFRPVKHTTKPGLTKGQEWVRLHWCWERRNWTLEDWKKVIWSDETSIILGSVRGKRRVWRRPFEVSHKHCRRQRWKGRMEFMFWGCFSYDHKGPCYTWPRETKKMTDAYREIIDSYNAKHKEEAQQAWELDNTMKRLSIAPSRSGRKAKFKFNEKTGAMTRNTKSGGIDWIRYREEVLKPLYFPFLRDLQGKEPQREWLAQEDNAPAHSSRWNRSLWKEEGLRYLEWPPNSPDLSAAEPPWYQLKVRTSRARNMNQLSRKRLEEIWKQEWLLYPQDKLRRCVQRIQGNLQWVLYLKGGNGYREGSSPPDLTDELYREIEGILRQPPPPTVTTRGRAAAGVTVEEDDSDVYVGQGLTRGDIRFLLKRPN